MKIILISFLVLIFSGLAAQKIVSGPFQGHTTDTSTTIWFLGEDTDSIAYNVIVANQCLEGGTSQYTTPLKGFENKDLVIYKVNITSLSPDTKYDVELSIKSSGEIIKHSQIKTTNSVEKDFTFLIGSCAFIGAGKDRIYKLWNSTRMFNTLAYEEKGDFMLWMGDNLYLLGDEYKKKDAALKRYNNIRQHKKLNRFMQTRHHYATWDDHDFGPNDCDGNFFFKDTTKMIFDAYWANPPLEHDNGIYYKISKGDVDIFMLDDRFNRNDAEGEKQLLGQEQLNWLKKGLTESKASFKIIVIGNQVLNNLEGHESFSQYPKEQNELHEHIKTDKVNGILFFSGDRHHSEILKVEKEGVYPLTEFTCSALTSWRYPWRNIIGQDKYNPLRDGKMMLTHNYGVVELSGEGKERTLTFTYKNKFGKVLRTHSLKLGDISF